METQDAAGRGRERACFPAPLYSLEKLIEWKRQALYQNPLGEVALYSLEKLIEWKLEKRNGFFFVFSALYSLEKLIEWKLFASADVII